MITPVSSYLPYSYHSCQPGFAGTYSMRLDCIIDMTLLLEKRAGVDKRVFSKQELQNLNLSEITKDYAIWKGTTSKEHTLYRGIGSFVHEDAVRNKFLSQIYNKKKGDTFSFKDSDSHSFITYTSYDPLEAYVYADFERICRDSVDNRVVIEIDMPRNSHMYVNPYGYRSSVELPANNIYELVEDPKIVTAKVKTRFNELVDTEFLHVKIKLKEENLV